MNRIAITAIATGSCIAGYFIGKVISQSERETYTPKGDYDADSEPEDADSDVRMYLVVRTDLNMSVGKTSAQCAHAAVMLYSQLCHTKRGQRLLAKWECNGQTKITLRCKNEASLLEIQRLAIDRGIPNALIYDAGRTEVAPNTATVLGIGPISKSRSQPVTGDLRLL